MATRYRDSERAPSILKDKLLIEVWKYKIPGRIGYNYALVDLGKMSRDKTSPVTQLKKTLPGAFSVRAATIKDIRRAAISSDDASPMVTQWFLDMISMIDSAY